MASATGYSLEIAPQDEAEVAAEMEALDASIPQALGGLLRVLREIADRGDDEMAENVTSIRVKPRLHMVRVGMVVAYYAYGQDNRIYLLSVARRGDQREAMTFALARLANVPPEI